VNAAGRARPDVPDVAIRPATRADVPRVHEIERASFSDPWTRESFASLLGNPHVYFAVAERHGTRPGGARSGGGHPGGSHQAAVVGYVIAWHVVDEAEIANVAVAPEARGSGLGARLLDAAVDTARAHGAGAVYLEVRESNAPARALYASRHFAPVGRRPNYYRRPVEDALVLRLELDPATFRGPA
jgi:ribosomal-protein-alanine N-acetyltransferase